MTSKSSRSQSKMRVIGKEIVADNVVSLRLADPDGCQAPTWGPGAHIDLALDGPMVRQYSLCGDVADGTSLTVAVLREAYGRGGSRWVHDVLQLGDLVSVSSPRNNFELVPASSYLFVAGGIGITPLMPMMQSATAAGSAWQLLYGGRTRASMAFADGLVVQHGDRIQLRPQDECGILDLAAALDEVEPGTAVYCCGPEPLLQAIEGACSGRASITLHVERFAAKAPTADAVDTSFEVELTKSGRTVAVSSSETVLDALLREGVDVEFSCREGTCGTCEVAVLGGVPDHRDSILTEDEQSQNDAMMICVSRSRTEKLLLDL